MPIPQKSNPIRLYCCFVWLLLLCGQCKFPEQQPFVALEAKFETVAVGQTQSPVAFIQRSSSTAGQFLWKFGDGAESIKRNPVHTYTEPRLFYEVELITFKSQSKNGLTDTTRQRIQIIPRTEALSVVNAKYLGTHEEEETGFAMAPTPEGGYLLAGRQGLYKLHLIKTNADGEQVWAKSLNIGRYLIFVTEIIALRSADPTDQGYVITGYEELGPNTHNAFVVRVNAQGVKQWERRLNAESEDELYKGVVEVGEDLLVLGKAKGISFIDTYARNGTQKSRNVLGSFEAESMLLTHNNELVFGGSIEGQPGVLRTDLDFNSLASKRVVIQTNQEDILITGKVNKVVELEDHNLVLIGQGSVDAENVSQGVRDFLKSLGITTFNPSMLGQGLGNLPINQDDLDTVRRVSTAFVIKMVASVGNTIRWKPLISYLDSVSLHDLTETNDGSLVVVGEYDNPFNNQDMVLIKFDKQLNLLPENLRLIGTPHNEVARNIWYDPTRNRVLFLGSGQRFDQLNDFLLGHLDF